MFIFKYIHLFPKINIHIFIISVSETKFFYTIYTFIKMYISIKSADSIPDTIFFFYKIYCIKEQDVHTVFDMNKIVFVVFMKLKVCCTFVKWVLMHCVGEDTLSTDSIFSLQKDKDSIPFILIEIFTNKLMHLVVAYSIWNINWLRCFL